MNEPIPKHRLSLGRNLRYGAEAAVFFAFMAVFRVIGLKAASGLGGWIGRTIFPLLPPDRIARANLAAAFPNKTEQECDEIRMTMWDNLGRVVGEYSHLDHFTPEGSDARISVEYPPGTTLNDLKGRSILFLSAHLANWEMLPILGEQKGLEGAAVVRPPNNPYIANWVARQRSIHGPATLIAKHNAMRQMLTQLRGQRVLYMLVDQKLREGIAVPFFGRDAMTTPAPAALALKLGARIVVVSNRRLPGPRFHATVQPPLDFTPTGDETSDIQTLTAAINACIEKIIRDDPGQWLWIHNRWPNERDADLLRKAQA
jgi:KDO2-lipid IV(A) lauroyltransferase